MDNCLQLLIIFPLIWSSACLPRALAFHPSKLTFSTSSLGISNLVNMLFPEEDISDVDPEQVLASFEMQALTDPKDLRKTYDSLTNFLQLWGRNLELRPDKGLTTPITATDFRNATYSYIFLDGSSSETEAEKADETETVISRPEIPANVSMTLKFRPPKRYLSYKEQKSMEKGVLPDRKGAKVDAWSPGGVLLLVHVIEQRNASATSIHNEPSWQLVLQARRCDIDGDTVIKYSSERAIVRRLKEAMRIWRKVREMP
jgi:hypothetical protein